MGFRCPTDFSDKYEMDMFEITGSQTGGHGPLGGGGAQGVFRGAMALLCAHVFLLVYISIPPNMLLL